MGLEGRIVRIVRVLKIDKYFGQHGILGKELNPRGHACSAGNILHVPLCILYARPTLDNVLYRDMLVFASTKL